MTSLVANTAEEKRTPTLTIHTSRGGDKEILVTGENLKIVVDFDDVDHIAVARDIGLVVDACNSFDALTEQVAELREVGQSAANRADDAERERDALTEANKKLRVLLERYMNTYPAFRIKPEGAPGSQARDEQERLMTLEDLARAAIAYARQVTP
jgi:FtsZ-binding cell division protein ZapB